MANVNVDVDIDVDDYVEYVDDHVLIDEFFGRMRSDEAFRKLIKKREPSQVDMSLDNEDLYAAEVHFNRKNYSEMIVYLERALGWKGLDKLKVTND